MPGREQAIPSPWRRQIVQPSLHSAQDASAAGETGPERPCEEGAKVPIRTVTTTTAATAKATRPSRFCDVGTGAAASDGGEVGARMARVRSLAAPCQRELPLKPR
ncbi:hypothetical protein ASF34_20585 [Methylobacterium sp. Leaf106]|nr:hypothetical protein ASF34_20585 [Methylobacterium sp. Leaf106]